MYLCVYLPSTSYQYSILMKRQTPDAQTLTSCFSLPAAASAQNIHASLHACAHDLCNEFPQVCLISIPISSKQASNDHFPFPQQCTFCSPGREVWLVVPAFGASCKDEIYSLPDFPYIRMNDYGALDHGAKKLMVIGFLWV